MSTQTQRLLLIFVFAALLIAGCRNNPSPVVPEDRGSIAARKSIDWPADSQLITEILAQISADSLRSYVERLVAFHTRHSLSDTISAEQGIGAARRWLVEKLRSFSSRLEVSFDAFEATICGESRVQKNVVARLPGSEMPEQQILVGAHYDSRTVDRCDGQGFAPGANDNGSGTAGVLELARVLSRYTFRHTLVFVAFTSEEQGLFGSRHYATAARARGDQIVAMLNMDVIGNVVGGSGTIDSTRVRCFSDDPSTSPHRQLARYAKLQAEAYQPELRIDMIPARDRPGRGGDHFAFYEQNYTAVRFTEPEDNLNHQHNPMDLPEFMNFSYHARVVRAVAAVVAGLADAPARPFGLKTRAGDTQGLLLEWQSSAVGDETLQYVVAYRRPESMIPDSLFDAGANRYLPLSGLGFPAYFSVAARRLNGTIGLFSSELLVGQ